MAAFIYLCYAFYYKAEADRSLKTGNHANDYIEYGRVLFSNKSIFKQRTGSIVLDTDSRFVRCNVYDLYETYCPDIRQA